VIGTIERIDAIQAEKERIQEAYSAAERLHTSQQNLALSRAQLAACEFTGTQLAEDSVQNRVARLRKDLLATENERRRAEEAIQTLQAEQYQRERPDQGVGSERGTPGRQRTGGGA